MSFIGRQLAIVCFPYPSNSKSAYLRLVRKTQEKSLVAKITPPSHLVATDSEVSTIASATPGAHLGIPGSMRHIFSSSKKPLAVMSVPVVALTLQDVQHLGSQRFTQVLEMPL